MGKSLSLDLRERVLAFIEEGHVLPRGGAAVPDIGGERGADPTALPAVRDGGASQAGASCGERTT